MKLKCFFGLHKWEYKHEMANFSRIGNKSKGKQFQIIVRYYPECSKKQGTLSLQIPNRWFDYGLTISEKRDKILNDLL